MSFGRAVEASYNATTHIAYMPTFIGTVLEPFIESHKTAHSYPYKSTIQHSIKMSNFTTNFFPFRTTSVITYGTTHDATNS
jgi:hypothetical protein